MNKKLNRLTLESFDKKYYIEYLQIHVQKADK